MDENEIYEALGVTPPEAETPAGNEPEPAGENGSSTTENAAGTGQEVGPEVQEQEPPAEAGEESPEQQETDNGSRQENAPPVASPDQEAKWRTMTEQAVVRALEEERARNKAQWDAFFSSAGLKDNLNGGKTITSLEEFQAWKSRYDRMKLERDLKDGKLTPEAFEAAIREEVERQRANGAPARAQRSEADRVAWGEEGQRNGAQFSAKPETERSGFRPDEVTQEQIDAELAEIHRLDGSVNSLVDILNMETGGAFQEAVRRGHSFLDAFKLANFERLQSVRQSEAARRSAQAARNSARSKDHLRASGGGNKGDAPVPGDVMELYRLLMPNAKEADIRADYNRTMKEMK